MEVAETPWFFLSTTSWVNLYIIDKILYLFVVYNSLYWWENINFVSLQIVTCIIWLKWNMHSSFCAYQLLELHAETESIQNQM